MIDRRILLATTAGLLGFASLRWLRGGAAKAAGKFEIEKTDAEWRAQLTPQQYEILRKEGTERPWSSPLLKEHRKGIFACAGCDLPLFSSATSSTTVRSRLACAIAWTATRCNSMRRRPRRAENPRQLLPARQMCPGPRTGAFLFK
jgi:hypothetical protein